MSFFTFRCLLHVTAPQTKNIIDFTSKHFKDVELVSENPEEPVYQIFYEGGHLYAESIIAMGYSTMINKNTIEFSFETYKKPPVDQIKKLIQRYYDFEFKLVYRFHDFDSNHIIEGRNCEIIETTMFDYDSYWAEQFPESSKAQELYEAFLQIPQEQYEKFIDFTNINRQHLNKLDKKSHKLAAALFNEAVKYGSVSDDDDELF